MQTSECSSFPRLGAVVIGRNESINLGRCIESLRGCGAIVYVDSGSNDESTSIAASLGAHVIELNLDIPFTAARARNAGFRKLDSLITDLEFVQFVDGDCEVVSGWITYALKFLEDHPDVAVVCGRRMERHPKSSIYNLMCDREWDTPIGEADACGGDAITRTTAFRAVGGFADTQVAHEEPELCGRIRKLGWKIWRINKQMTLHDAAMHRLGQFYTRCRRAGFGITQCLVGSGFDIDPNGKRIFQSAFFWSIILPAATLILTATVDPLSIIAFAIYPAQIVRNAIKNRSRLDDGLQCLTASSLYMLDKLAFVHGSLEFFVKHLLGLKKEAIFYR